MKRPIQCGWFAPVRTARTPGTRSAADVSMRTMRAWACGLRSTLPQRQLSEARSAAKRRCPLTLSGPSMRGVRLPITRIVMPCLPYLLALGCSEINLRPTVLRRYLCQQLFKAVALLVWRHLAAAGGVWFRFHWSTFLRVIINAWEWGVYICVPMMTVTTPPTANRVPRTSGSVMRSSRCRKKCASTSATTGLSANTGETTITGALLSAR